MRNSHYTLTARDVQEHAAHLLQKHLKLPDYSKRCSANVLLCVVFVAAARLTSLFAACRRLAKAPSGETLRKALLSTLPGYAALAICNLQSHDPGASPSAPSSSAC